MTSLKLHIGGQKAHPDWKILDVEPRPEVDFVGNAAALDQFADNSVAVIYASHVLEHFYYWLNSELSNTLSEWYRVIQPGGKLLVSVPNLKILCWLYQNPNLLTEERFYLMRIMFGGHVNEHDVHKVGFDADILASFLVKAGFIDCQEVSEFGLFEDCSSLRVMDTLISLNMVAMKPKSDELILSNGEN